MLSPETLAAYQAAESIKFLARRNNLVQYREVYVGDRQIYTIHLFPAIGITPQDLSHIFADGLEDSTTYVGLGSMHGTEAFALLATLLGKTIEVYQMDGLGETLGHYTVKPLTAPEAAKAAANWTRWVMEKRASISQITAKS